MQIEFLHERKATVKGWSFMLDLREREDGLWELRERPERLPLEYSIRARNPRGA
jgi:hypothetical protein